MVLATDTESDTIEDRIIRIDKDTEEIIDVFDLAEVFGEYDNNGNLLRQYSMKLSDRFIYRVYKYDFKGILFS